MLFQRLFAALAMAGLSHAALADGPMAARSLYANLALAGKKLKVSEQDALVARTLVRGMYRVEDAKGEFVTFVNEDGTLYGDRHGLYAFPKQGAAPRRMAGEQLAAFRLEVVNAVDRDLLILSVHGNGGNRESTLLFSGKDCPACHTLEKDLEQTRYNGMFYIVPSPRTTVEGEDLEEWQSVAKVWCAKDRGRAWRDYMANKPVPTAKPCAFSDAGVAQKAWLNLYSILRNTGLTVTGFPGFVYEDGTFSAGVEGARKQVEPVAIRANWLPRTFPPNPPMGLPADAFRPQPVKVPRR